MSFTHCCTSNQPHSKNLTSLFQSIFLSKHISLYALGRLKWILDIVWPLNQHFNLKNRRNWRTTFFMLRFLIGIICVLLHRPKKLTLRENILILCCKKPSISIEFTWKLTGKTWKVYSQVPNKQRVYSLNYLMFLALTRARS